MMMINLNLLPFQTTCREGGAVCTKGGGVGRTRRVCPCDLPRPQCALWGEVHYVICPESQSSRIPESQTPVDPSVPYQERCIIWSTSGSIPSQWEGICILWSISGLVCLWSTSSLIVIYLWSTRALEVNYPRMSSLDIIGGHSTPLLCDRHTDFPKWNEIFPVTLKSVKAHASVISPQLLVIPAATSAATKVITCQAWCNCLDYQSWQMKLKMMRGNICAQIYYWPPL